MMTIRHAVDLLDIAAASSPDGVFLRGANHMTFGELAEASHAIAAWLRAHSLSPGDRILIATSNHAEAIATAFGAARCGVTFAFLHHTIPPLGFRRIVEQVEPSCVALDSTTAGLQSVVAAVPLLAIGGATIAGATPLADVLAVNRAARIESVRHDPLCLVYTSGSSGEPRGVMVSHDNVAFTVSAIQERLRYRADDTIGLYLPLSFDYGLYQLFLALSARASIYIGQPDLVPLRLCNDLDDERITVLPGVPSLFSVFVRMLERTPRKLPSLRAVTNTGEQLPVITIDRLRALLPQLELFLMYGLTECKRVSILLPGELEAHPGSVGRPLDGTTAKIVLSDGSVAPDDTPGELVVSGPHLTMGYWRAPEETARCFRVAEDGTRLLFTGDTCRRSADGYLYFEGRGDAQTKRRGFRISLLEIESAALAVTGTVSAAAVAPPHSDELHLFLTGDGYSVNADAVIRELRERLEPHKIPDRIHVLASLPTTSHGKVDQQRLCALAAEMAQ
jgi:acyl-CoA synthetase (AMP-forming)/AMP-acid ligase II